MTIRRGSAYGEVGVRLAEDGVVCRSDADARAVVEAARRDGAPFPAIGLLGGDLCRTLAGPGDEGRLHSAEAVTFTVDVGEVLADGRWHLFVAHLVAHTRSWRRAVVAMNAQWRGPWNLGPRAHPNDGLLDTYDADLTWSDLPKVRRRLHHGAHLPHPGIKERRTRSIQIDMGRPVPVWLDGEHALTARALSLRCRPDALRVTV